MKARNIYLVLIPTLFLSACTTMERFKTDKIFVDSSGNNMARLKLTTNIQDVFIIPDSDCISISKDVFSINNKRPERKTEGWSLWSGWSKAPFEENKNKVIGMPDISLDDLNNKYNVGLRDKTYISKEFNIDPNRSYTIFIKTIGKYIQLLFNSPEDEFGFGLAFKPQAKQDYQLIIQADTNYYTQWTSATTANTSSNYTYSYKLLNITNGIVSRAENSIVHRAFGCKK